MDEKNDVVQERSHPDEANEDETDLPAIPFILEDGSAGKPIYTSLDTSKSQIRLLYINPTSCCTCHEICCDLYKVSFDDNPGYAALSYCWGDVNDKVEICLTGQPLAVPRALVNALQRLKEMPEGYYWVDAVCINQGDLEERAAQVGLMADIYGYALMVYSFLSDEKPIEIGTKEVSVGMDDFETAENGCDDPEEILKGRRLSLQCKSAKKERHIHDERHAHRNIVALDLADFAETYFAYMGETESTNMENSVNTTEKEEESQEKEQPDNSEQIPRPEAIQPPPEFLQNTIDLALFWCNIVFDQLQEEPAVVSKNPHRVQGMPVLVNDVATPIVQFLKNRYWSRVWIFQEMVLADELTFIGTHTSIASSKLEKVCTWLRDIQSDRVLRPLFLDWREWSDFKQKLQFAELHPLSMRHCHTLAEAIDRDEKTAAELAGPRDKLFQRFRHLHATDPHDHIYGILGVLQVQFRADYKRSVRDLYILWARWLARSRPAAGFKFLEQAGTSRDRGLNPHDLPSWVPDWSSPRHTGFSNSENFTAAADISGHYVVKADGSLHLDGMIIDKIMPRRNRGKNLFLQYYHTLNVHGDPSGDPPLQVLYRVMTRDDHSACRNGEYDRYNIDLLREFVSFGAMLQSSDDDNMFTLLDTDESWSAIAWAVNDYFGIEAGGGFQWNPMRMLSENLTDDELSTLTTGDPKIDAMLTSILDVTADTFEFLGEGDELLKVVMDQCRLFRTEKGYIGNSGPYVQAGDLVCVLVGCKVPCVLRKVQDHYVIVEPAFVHGLMYGEAKWLLEDGGCVVERFEIR